MFREALHDLVQGVDGGLASTVMDLEGIPIESFTRESSSKDIEAVGVDASVLVKSVLRATEMLDGGAAQEVSVRSDRLVTLIRVVNETYFITLTLTPGANIGKARYLLRTLGPRLAEALE
jgi:predicted regulator of Ras-like GTPase activity (Roadblock/LC7/MglB family)